MREGALDARLDGSKVRRLSRNSVSDRRMRECVAHCGKEETGALAVCRVL